MTMRKTVRLICLAVVTVALQLCCLCAAQAASTYYVDNENGNDTNSGLSEAQAWKTQAPLSRLQPGDTVLFHAGQLWYDFYYNVPCSNLTFGAYGEGERPVLSGAVPVQGWERASRLPDGVSAAASDTIYTLKPPAGTVPHLIKAGDTVFREASSEHIEKGRYFYDGVSGIVYLSSPGGNPDSLGMTQLQKQPHSFFINAKTRITIRGLHMTMTGGAGVNIQSGDSKYILVEDNEMSFAESYDSDGSGINCSAIWDSEFRDNIIHDVYGDGILLWNCKGCTVSGNRIWNVSRGKNTGGDGIQSAGKAGNASPDNKIINNYVNMSNSGTGKGCIQQENGDNVVIEGNVCLYGSFGVECNSNNGIVKNNLCAYQGTQTPYNWTAGIYTSEDEDVTGMVICDNIVYKTRPYGIRLGSQGGNYRSEFQIYNNTVYSTGTAFAALVPFSGVVKNNIFYDESGKKTGSVYTVSSIKAGEAVASDHNVIYPHRTGFMAWQGISYNTIWAVREVKGLELASRISQPVFWGDKNGWSDPPQREEFRLYAHSPGARDGGAVYLNGEAVYEDGCAVGAVQELIASGEPDVVDPEKPGEEGEPAFQKGLIAYEGFQYDALSSLEGLNGGVGWAGGWQVSSTGENQTRIDPETMVFDGVYATGRKLLFRTGVSRTLAEPIGMENGIYYMGFLIKNSTGYGFSLSLSDGANTIALRKESKSNWQVKMRTKWITSTSASEADGFVLLKLVIKDSRMDVSVWVNPDLSLGEAGLGPADVSDYAGVKITPQTVGFSIASGTESKANAQLDEIRIGQNLESVTKQVHAKPPALGAGELSILNGSEEIENGIYYDALSGPLTGSAYVYNPPGEDVPVLLLAALKKNGVLTEVKLSRFSVEADWEGIQTLPLDFQCLTDEDYTIQLFCWQEDTLQPLSAGKAINIYKSIEIPEPPED